MSERFGARLKRLRLATPWTGPVRPHLVGTRWDGGGHLSYAALGREAGVDPGHLHRMEHGRQSPSRAVVLRLADALGCSAHETALLLADAGLWPWTDAGDAETTLLVALGEAVLAGDYRRVRGANIVPPADGTTSLERTVIDGSRAMHQQL